LPELPLEASRINLFFHCFDPIGFLKNPIFSPKFA